MSSSRKTINELASMFQDHVNWLGRYGSVPRRMALRIVNVQAGEVLDRIPRLLALERVVRRISWQWMHEAWDVVTGMTCESPRECAGPRKPIPSGMGGFTGMTDRKTPAGLNLPTGAMPSGVGTGGWDPPDTPEKGLALPLVPAPLRFVTAASCLGSAACGGPI